MAKYGVWMLESVVLKYCDWGGSSRGIRTFINDILPELKANSPQLNVQTVLRKNRHPMIVGLYRNGRSKPVCVKNLSPEDVMEQVFWIRNSHGRGKDYKVVARRHLTRNPSIQGTWTPDTFAAQLELTNARRLDAMKSQISY